MQINLRKQFSDFRLETRLENGGFREFEAASRADVSAGKTPGDARVLNYTAVETIMATEYNSCIKENGILAIVVSIVIVVTVLVDCDK